MVAMETDHKLKLLLLGLLMTIWIPALKANIGEIDEHWLNRQRQANEHAKAAYNHDPMHHVDHLNREVHKVWDGMNDTRRELRHKYDGPCKVTNPMDACWRCDPNWAENRKKLADCALGFAHGTIGGRDGQFYEVTEETDENTVDPKPGTLRYAVTREEPLWITFAGDMNIVLQEELMVASDKTIDARGSHINIMDGAQITLQYVKNIIISNLHIKGSIPKQGGLIRDSLDHYGFRTASDGDGISLFGASNVWIDHVSASACSDGLIDVIAGSTAITISNSHFTDHNKVMLFGSSDSYTKDEIMQITLAFNHFGRGCVQRMPRCRFGFFHVLNNDYTRWIMYAIGGSSHPTILSQGNRYVAPFSGVAKEVCNRVNTGEDEWKNWNWKSEGDLMVNGATFTQSGSPIREIPNGGGIDAKPGTFVSEITLNAGPLKCTPGEPC